MNINNSVKDKTFFARILSIKQVGDKMKIMGVTPTHYIEYDVEDYYFAGGIYLYIVYTNNKNKKTKQRFNLREWDVLNILGENIYDRGYSYAD